MANKRLSDAKAALLVPLLTDYLSMRGYSLDAIRSAPRHITTAIQNLETCDSWGLYVWWDRDGQVEKPAYIGSAIGSSGLYGRAVAQHLRVRYTESRPDKINETEDRTFEVIKKGIKVKAREKTPVRRFVFNSNTHLQSPEDTVRFLEENYLISIFGWHTSERSALVEQEIEAIEQCLIYLFKPPMNDKHVNNLGAFARNAVNSIHPAFFD